MTVRREVSGTDTFVYTQTWSIDIRLIGVTKALTNGAVLAQTSYFFDGDGVRVRKVPPRACRGDDPDGTTLYAGPVEQTIGPGGTATAEYFDDISGTSTLTAFVATRNETVTAGFQQTFTVPPAGLGNEPWGVRYQIWLMVPATDSYRLAVYADDGFILIGQGLSLSNATARDAITTEASTVLTLTAGAVYNFALTYLNYSATTTGTLQLLWRKGGGALEAVPGEFIRARGRRDYYNFGGAVVAMKEGVISTAPRVLTYLHGDHLGSVSLTTNAAGQKVSEQRYKPYGEVRWTSSSGLPTDKQFTGQMRLSEGYVGTLYDYVARAYDPVLSRFISADTIVPGAGKGQTLNRYAYALNSPLRYSDPSGHRACNDSDDCEPAGGRSDWPPPPPPPSFVAGAIVLALTLPGTAAAAAGASPILWFGAGMAFYGAVVYAVFTSDATFDFPPYPLPATEPGAIGSTYPPGGSSTLQVDNTPLPYGGPETLTTDGLFPNVLPEPVVPLPWMPAKTNPEDDNVPKIGRRNGLQGQELRDWGDFVEEEKARGDRGTLNDKGDFTWEELEDLIDEFLKGLGR